MTDPASGAPRLSALVVARNEETRLPDCLAALTFADEIVVVLDRTTDRSAEIAQRFKARVIEGAWEIEGARRNTGIEACTGDWILEVDADERVPQALAQEIRRVIAASRYARHLVPVDNYVGKRLVRYGWGAGFGKSAAYALYRKGTKSWGADRVHPALSFTGEVGPSLINRLDHYVDRDISDMMKRLDRYSTAKAADLVAKGDIGTFGHNVRRIFSRFLKCYISRKGYREGRYGFLVALMAGLFPLMSHLKARELQEAERE
jgi:glycosyltransferase involved in cell wall biosynthesis